MPSIEQLPPLKSAFQLIDQLPNSSEIWNRIFVATRFYINYSHVKPKFDTPERFFEVLRRSTYEATSLHKIAKDYGAAHRSIVNAWDIMHTICTICLTQTELDTIGLSPAELSQQALQVREVMHTYQSAYVNLVSTEEVAPIREANSHFEQLLTALSSGIGVEGFLQDYVGDNYPSYFNVPKLYAVEHDYRRGFQDKPKLGPGHSGKYNYAFLRRALFARYLEQLCGDNSVPEPEVDPEHVIRSLRRIVELAPGNEDYLSVAQQFIPKLPYYESRLIGDKNYYQGIASLNIYAYLRLYEDAGKVPYPILHILMSEAKGVPQKTLATDLAAQGIYFSEKTITNEIRGASWLIENILLIPNLASASNSAFIKTIKRAHKYDIAVLTAAAGKLDQLEA